MLDIDPADVVRKGRLQPGRVFLADTASSRSAGRRGSEVRPGQQTAVTRTGCTPALKNVCGPGTAAPCGRELTTQAASRGRAEGSAGPDGQDRGRADRVDGHRHARRRSLTAPAVLRLLLPAARAGRQPAVGRDPGRAGHLAGAVHRPGRRPVRAGHLLRQVVLPYPVIDGDEYSFESFTVSDDGDLRVSHRMWWMAGVSMSGGGAALERPARRDLRRGVHRDRGGAHVVGLVLIAGSREPTRGSRRPSAAHRDRAPSPDPGADPDRASLIVESGDAREVHHIALLVGYGAAAVNPYLALQAWRTWFAAARWMASRPRRPWARAF